MRAFPGRGCSRVWGSSRRCSCPDLEHDHPIRCSECGLRGCVERFAIELVAVGYGCQRLADPQIRVKELHLDRRSVCESDDRSGMDLVADVGVHRVSEQFALLS